MKVLVVVASGIADKPLEELGGRTPLEAADSPFLDRMAAEGQAGGWGPASSGQAPDNALCALLGYDHISGAVMEAAGADIVLREEEVAFRANFVCLKPGATNVVMFDPIGCGVSDEEGAQLVGYLEAHLAADPGEEIRLYPIGGHRAVLTYRKAGFRVPEDALAGFSSPHDIVGDTIDRHLPTSDTARRFVHIVNDSQMILATHPQMREKLESTMFAANSLWLWGGGQSASPPPISQALGGRRVTFVAGEPAILGMGRLGGAEVIRIASDSSASGNATVEAARKALGASDFVLLFTDGAAEASERGDTAAKIAAIEALDAEILAPFIENPGEGPCRILVLSDHIASTESRRRERGPVPYAMADWEGGSLAPPASPPHFTDALAGLWAKLSGRNRSAGNDAASRTFSERLCETSRPLTARTLRERLLAA